MNKEDEVLRFLRRFKDKARIFGVVFRDDRGKNAQSLLDLEITPLKRLEIVLNLKVEDFVDGPLEDTLHKIADLWGVWKESKGKGRLHQDFLGLHGQQRRVHIFPYSRVQTGL